MIHEMLRVGPLDCNCSIFGDETTREAMVVDPGGNIAEILQKLAEHGLKVKLIYITHAHIDHIAGAHELKLATGAPVYMNRDDKILSDYMDMQAQMIGMEIIPQDPGIDVEAHEGDSLNIGPTVFQVIETPGHTPGSTSLWSAKERMLVAGDTLFFDSIGRTDLPGGDSRKIIQSIKGKLWKLPEDTVVIPGHGWNTQIGREKENNPFVKGD